VANIHHENATTQTTIRLTVINILDLFPNDKIQINQTFYYG